MRQKGLGTNLSVSLLKQTPATSGCSPVLAIPSFPTGMRSKEPDEQGQHSCFARLSKEVLTEQNFDGINFPQGKAGVSRAFAQGTPAFSSVCSSKA